MGQKGGDSREVESGVKIRIKVIHTIHTEVLKTGPLLGRYAAFSRNGPAALGQT
jgi:hypothetical protein